MVAFLCHASSSIHNKCPWGLSWFQRGMPLIELRPRCNRRSAVGMQSFKGTPQIHLIIPLSAVTSSITTGQVWLPYKSTFLVYMLKTFPLSFRLVRIEVESAEERHKMELAPTPMVHTPQGYFGLLNEILLQSWN